MKFSEKNMGEDIYKQIYNKTPKAIYKNFPSRIDLRKVLKQFPIKSLKVFSNKLRKALPKE